MDSVDNTEVHVVCYRLSAVNVSSCGYVKVFEQPLFTSCSGFISVIPSEVQENVTEPPEKPGKYENVYTCPTNLKHDHLTAHLSPAQFVFLYGRTLRQLLCIFVCGQLTYLYSLTRSVCFKRNY